MGILRSVVETLIISTIILLLLAYSPLFLDCDPQIPSESLPKTLEGPLKLNDKLNKAEKIFLGQVKWPESLAVQDGIIYTGVNDGNILSIEGSKIKPVLRTGEHCDGQWEEPKCGRPLGMRFHKDKNLYVVDAYHGLFKVDLKKRKKQLLLPSFTIVDNKPLTFMNDLVITDKGIIYFTQSSTRWNLTSVVFSLMEHDTSGRLLSFDPTTKQVTVLAKDLSVPNGLELSHDGANLLFAECAGFRIMQYNLKQPNKGLQRFSSNLPGEPDNIRRSPRGGYWVALNSARSQENPTLSDRLAPYPIARKVMIRLLHAVGSILTKAAHYIPHHTTKEVAFDALSARFLMDILPAHGMILLLDDKGQIVESLQSPDGQVAHLSEVLEHQGHLYIGSWRNKFLAKLKV